MAPGISADANKMKLRPPPLAYRAKGSPPKIPPTTPLVFVVDLLGT
jgi:FKBP-type peptidyl-prolyl cis-trans isomerase